MERTYIISVQGTPESAERAVKMLDRIFRQRYNVYGVYRDRSAYDAVVDCYTIDVLLTADWSDDRLTPEYRPTAIYKAWINRLMDDPAWNDMVIGNMVECEGRE